MKDRHSRQTFLGANSHAILRALHVGIVGLGGGGSHVAQQLAHVGVGVFTIVDHDRIDESNLNRLVGGTAADVDDGALKTAIAARVIRGVSPQASIREINTEWQKNADALWRCDVIVGCLDSYAGRLELEELARRYLIPYVDLGMDVHEMAGGFGITGQVTVSLPGHPCLRCMGVIRETDRGRDAEAYGAAGGRPQVVWPNAILASTAVGIVIGMATPWRSGSPSLLLEYDGNAHTIQASTLLQFLVDPCPHFHGVDNLGDPWFSTRR